jgi:hypothetical protein
MIERFIRAITCSPKNDISWKTYADDDTKAPIRRRLQTYGYQPVARREFRLLILHSGQFDDALSATLVRSSLDDLRELAYETVSYVWGDANLKAQLLVDNAILEIPASAGAVLRQVRYKTKPRRLWIDAVCINQADLKERQQQVSYMRYIYTNSSRNLIYLGHSDNHTEAALGTISAILADLARQVQSYSKLQALLYKSDGSPATESGHSKASPYDNEALQSLYDRPWFTRLWVVQEAALAPKNVCLWGEYQLPLFNLLRAAVWYRYKNYRFEIIRDKSFVKAARFYDTVYYGATSRPFSSSRAQRSPASYLDLSRHFESSVASDKVFAMLGLLDDRIKHDDFWALLTPDYHKPTSLVFRDAFRAALLQDQMLQRPLSLNIVHHWSQQDVDGTDLPSWVPDLRRKGDRTQEAYDLCPYFNACPSGQKHYQHDISPIPSDTLALRGTAIDEIVSIGPMSPFGSTWLQDLEFVELSAEIAQVKDLSDQNSVATGTFARTLVAGVDVLQHRQDLTTTAKSFVKWYAWLRSVLMLDDLQVDPETATQEFASALAQACHMRRLFRTRQGHLGLGPKVMQVGDQAVVLYGCHVISILRPVPDGINHHFVGQCYVDGMMDGEILAQCGAEPKDQRTFNL